jgi:putative acetyltransferase
MTLRLEPDDLARPVVRETLEQHLADMNAASPTGTGYALDLDGLARPEVTVFTTWEDGELLGTCALRDRGVFGEPGGEIKSMRTTDAARGRGVGTFTLYEVLRIAAARRYPAVWLETGTEDFFVPARALYHRAGFALCEPFAPYAYDPRSVYMRKDLRPGDAPAVR